MAMKKPKLSRAERAEKARRRAELMTIFVNGKQKRVHRAPLIDGMDPDEFIRRNADEIWLHQNEMWEEIRGNNLLSRRVQTRMIENEDDAGTVRTNP